MTENICVSFGFTLTVPNVVDKESIVIHFHSKNVQLYINHYEKLQLIVKIPYKHIFPHESQTFPEN